MTEAELGGLHCPYCGSSLQLEAEFSSGLLGNSYGIVRCSCYRYPIIEGILILKQLSGPADSRDRRVEYLEAGDPRSALHHALYESSPIAPPRRPVQATYKLLSGLNRIFSPKLTDSKESQVMVDVGGGSLTFHEILSRLRPAGFADYLFQRYANNSFLASIALILLLKEFNGEGHSPAPRLLRERDTRNRNESNDWTDSARARKAPRVLDFACGVGHASFLIKSIFPQFSVVAADHDFVNLYIGRRYLIPNVTCLCVDAEVPLPFLDNSFDAVFCLDGFHYIRSKVALLSEFDRIVHQFGLWLFPHLHNASLHNVSPGIPLTYEEYARCFDFIPGRISSEAEVFQSLLRDQSLDLGVIPSADEVRRSNVFTLIASRRDDLWRSHGNITSLLWRDKAPLSINPIYKVTEQGASMRLEMEWPNAGLEAECAAIKQYLPRELQIERSLWERFKRGSATAVDEPIIQKLINSFVLVRLPQNYGGFV